MLKSTCLFITFCLGPLFCVAQDSTITNSSGKTIDFRNADVQLKYILNNEFARLITGNTFAGLGNYAAVSTTDKTLSASINIVREKWVINIKGSGGATEGIVTLFQNTKMNTDVTMGVSFHRLVGKRSISINTLNISKINDVTRQLQEKFNSDSLKVKTFDYEYDKQMKAKLKEIEGINELIKANARDEDKARIYSRQRDVVVNELADLKSQKEKHRTNLSSIIAALRATRPFDPVKFTADSLAALAFEFSFDKKIKAKEAELKEVDDVLQNNTYDAEKAKRYAQNLTLLQRDILLLDRDLEKYRTSHSKVIGELRYDMEIAKIKNWAQVDAIKADDISLKWVTFGGEGTQNTFKLFDKTRPEAERIDDKSDFTPSFLFAFSGYSNIPLKRGSKPGARHVKFYSLGAKGKFGNNISSLALKEITTTDSISPAQTLTKKESVYVGDFVSSELSVTVFGDYYQFLGNRDNVGYHVRGTVDVGPFKPVTSLRAGLLFPFIKADDKGSFVNLEFFIGLNDIFKNSKDESALRRNVVGIQGTVPLNFKIL